MDTANQPLDPETPDSREGDSVANRHAAAAREKAEPTFGSASLTLSAFFVCAAVLLYAGNHMGKLSAGYDSTRYLVPGYVPEQSPGDNVTAEKKDWIVEYTALGKKRYTACAACHGPDGAGNPASNYPPLAGSEWVNGNTEKIGLIILAGLQGPITVKGKPYSNVMPSQAAGMTAKDLGAVMTYIRRSFGNDSSIVTPEMAQVALDLQAKRLAAGKAAVTVAELNAEYDKMLPGSEVDLKTGQPAGAAPVDAAATPGEASAPVAAPK